MDLTKRLAGKVIAVAGGGGIGDVLAQRYAAEGASVVLGDLNADAAETVAEGIREAGGQAVGVHLDGADQASNAAFIGRAVSEYGGLDGCHLNFSSFVDAKSPEDIVDLPLDVFDEVVRVNARGFFLLTREAIPPMLKRGGGSMVYTSSGAAHSPAPNRVAYAMTKAATHALMRNVATRFGAEGIRSNCIAPGYIVHDRLLKNAAPGLMDRVNQGVVYTKRLANSMDIAALSALLMADEGAAITGQVLSVDRGGSMRP